MQNHATLFTSTSRAVGLFLAFLVSLTPAIAQDLIPASPPQARPIALIGATAHPISSPHIDNAMLLFDNGRITYIGPRSAAPPLPTGTQTLDVSGFHIYPGLVAAKTELGLTEISAVRAMRDTREVGDITPEVRAAVSINPDSTLIPVARTNGVLTAAVFPAGGLIPGRASIIRLDGWTWEDLTILDAAGLCINWPQAYRAPNRWTGKFDPNDRTKDRVRTISDFFAHARSYHALAQNDRTIDLRLEAVEPQLLLGQDQRPVLIAASELSAITSAVEWALASELRPIIVGGRDAHLCSDLLKEHNVPVILTDPLGFPRRADADYNEAFTHPARLEAAGVTWCFAPADTDANVRNLPYDAAMAVAHGLHPDVAIRAITLSPAQILGVGHLLGSLEVGKAATIIITDGSPLEITTNVAHAFIDGRHIDLSNKQTQLRDKYIEKYRQLDALDQRKP